jgi:hypothetical protein
VKRNAQVVQFRTGTGASGQAKAVAMNFSAFLGSNQVFERFTLLSDASNQALDAVRSRSERSAKP